MKRALLFVSSIALLFPAFIYANDPGPMPVMQVENEQSSEQAEKTDYIQAYDSIGRPSITFLINNRLGRRDFQWRPSEQRLERKSNANKSVRGGNSKESSEYTESNINFEKEKVYSDDTVNIRLADLSSAFFETLTDLNVRVYDSETIQQIYQRYPDEEALIDALKGKVDLLGEIYLHNLNSPVVNAQLRILDINNGRLLAQSMTHLSGDKIPAGEENMSFKYISTSKGYQKVVVPIECETGDRQCQKMNSQQFRRGSLLANEFMYQLIKGYE